MSNEELVTLCKNDKSYILELWENVKSLGIMVSKKYLAHIEADDLEQLAFMALYDAVNDFDGAAGLAFTTFYGHCVRWTILKHLEENGHTVRLPSYLHQRVREYKETVKLYEQELHRKPTEQELMYHLQISSVELKTLQLALQSRTLKSLDAPVGTDEENDSLGNMLADSSDQMTEVLDRVQNEELHEHLIEAMEATLNDVEREVLKSRYFDGQTLAEVAERFERTPEAIRQRERGAFRKIKKSEEHSERLKSYLPEKVHAHAYKGSLQGYLNTWMSSTERAVFELLDDEE